MIWSYISAVIQNKLCTTYYFKKQRLGIVVEELSKMEVIDCTKCNHEKHND